MRRALILLAVVAAFAAASSAEAQSLCESEYCTKTKSTCSLVGVACWNDYGTYCNHCSCAPTSMKTNCCLKTSTCCPAASDLLEGETTMCPLRPSGSASAPAPESGKAAPAAARAEAQE